MSSSVSSEKSSGCVTPIAFSDIRITFGSFFCVPKIINKTLKISSFIEMNLIITMIALYSFNKNLYALSFHTYFLFSKIFYYLNLKKIQVKIDKINKIVANYFFKNN
ncbi:hypothetical protein ACKWTF_013754 [Chironomus riparius]